MFLLLEIFVSQILVGRTRFAMLVLTGQDKPDQYALAHEVIQAMLFEFVPEENVSMMMSVLLI